MQNISEISAALDEAIKEVRSAKEELDKANEAVQNCSTKYSVSLSKAREIKSQLDINLRETFPELGNSSSRVRGA